MRSVSRICGIAVLGACTRTPPGGSAPIGLAMSCRRRSWWRLDDVSGIDLPWLYGVARNVVRQDIRSVSRYERLRAAIQAGGATRSAEEEALTNLGVVRALASLPEVDAEIVLLAAWEGLASKEIGSIVGLSGPAVRMRLSRAIRSLVTFDSREELEQ